MFIGAALVVVGLVVLVDNLHLPWLRWLNFGFLWPVAFIIVGALLVWRRLQKP
jgi:hypothetical protein